MKLLWEDAGAAGAQQDAGREFTPEQMAWLAMIKDHIATLVRHW